MKETQEPKELQVLLESKRRQACFISEDIENIIARLRPVCDHSETEPYVWEHDNGSGVQHNINGKRCQYCGLVDHWNRGRFINPHEN